MENDIKVFMPESKKIILAGKEYEIKKLGLRQTLKLMALVGSFQESVRKIIVKEFENEGDKDFIKIVSNMTDEELPKLFSILLNDDDIPAMRNIDDTVEISDLIVAITEVNDIEKIISNFMVAAEKVKKAMATLKSSDSQPS